jgi:hypothetical protein
MGIFDWLHVEGEATPIMEDGDSISPPTSRRDRQAAWEERDVVYEIDAIDGEIDWDATKKLREKKGLWK